MHQLEKDFQSWDYVDCHHLSCCGAVGHIHLDSQSYLEAVLHHSVLAVYIYSIATFAGVTAEGILTTAGISQALPKMKGVCMWHT